MSEQEVKLNVPRAARPGVAREMARGDSRSIHLHAMYFDTPSRELARAKIALRLRLEGDTWIQTLKTPGADAITRVEMNHPRPGPILDLSVYAGTEVEAALTSVQGDLALRYETDVLRVVRKHRSRLGTVELAFDTGEVRAGAFSLPICELEFELLSGRVAAIFETARGWHQRHGLVMDPRSKSERGDALASLALDLDGEPLDKSNPDDPSTVTERNKRTERIKSFWAPRGIAPVKLRTDMTASHALAQVTAECLDQIARNAAFLAEVDTAGIYCAGGPEHVHQLRVGVRRLRSAWKLFDGIAVLPPDSLQDDIRRHFGDFGANRDRDVQNATVLPRLLSAGMPPLPEEPPGDADDSETLARARGFQGALLALLEWSVTPQPSLTSVNAMAAAQASATLQAQAAEAIAARAATGVGEPDPGQPTLTDSATADGGTKIASLDSAAHHPAPAVHIVPTIIPLGPTANTDGLDTLLLTRLHTWHKQITKRGRHFARLDIEKKHALRKRVKLLRYSLGFCESLLGTSRLRAYRKHLAVVQDLLGEFNDLAVAHETYIARAQKTEQAWFAVGWLAAIQDRTTSQAQAALVALGRAPGFWK